MTVTKQGCVFVFFFFAVIFITGVIFNSIFGPRFLSNPVAAWIFFSVIIGACLFFPFIRVILLKIKEENTDKKQKSYICPICNTIVEKGQDTCPKCGKRI